ncbi:aspartate aminotransferase family protein [Portibacter marinus]|uniref:aspartate aminotransferase family protein n=1 Tax=Portibacter marinus TaxID=2898660 RepID=UPI001F2358F6|nr:aminotransferase class III-fold pyridoxal phosphate-dependent enzyme [Portibacter marinus]
MNLFDVYSQYNVEPISGKGSYVYDAKGTEYLDFYGGHAVISIGHSHPHYVKRLKDQLDRIGFYSNAVQNSLQKELADKLEETSRVEDYAFFLCNSGAEANENALKLASFHTGNTRIIALEKGFHGRTSAAVRATHNFDIQAPINQGYDIEYVPINDVRAMQSELASGGVCAVIIEAVQGIGGCRTCDPEYLREVYNLCRIYDAILIMDEVQAGYGRCGRFFAWEYADIRPHIITTAKGMGNGFPIAGVLIDERTFQPKKGMLGTTFGGNHLACAAGIAVLEVIQNERLIDRSYQLGSFFRSRLEQTFGSTFEILGKGLMIGLKFNHSTASIRKNLLYEEHIFSGSSGDPNTMRILPPLNTTEKEIEHFLEGLSKVMENVETA